jgi:dihydrofolate reductase
MGKLTFSIAMSLDGFVAGPDATLEEPLGRRGEELHEWVLALPGWREAHGRPGGEVTEATKASDDLLVEAMRATGATIMGRRMFSGGSGPWADDPNPDGWWGDTPPFGHAVFVLTNHERQSQQMEGGTTFHFVTDGIESALEQAQAAAGDKNVGIGGGADVAQQYLRARLIDEMTINVVPILLGDGVRLFDRTRDGLPALELTGAIDTPAVTHLQYRVLN